MSTADALHYDVRRYAGLGGSSKQLRSTTRIIIRTVKIPRCRDQFACSQQDWKNPCSWTLCSDWANPRRKLDTGTRGPERHTRLLFDLRSTFGNDCSRESQILSSTSSNFWLSQATWMGRDTSQPIHDPFTDTSAKVRQTVDCASQWARSSSMQRPYVAGCKATTRERDMRFRPRKSHQSKICLHRCHGT